jgi:hypothetical protein
MRVKTPVIMPKLGRTLSTRDIIESVMRHHHLLVEILVRMQKVSGIEPNSVMI